MPELPVFRNLIGGVVGPAASGALIDSINPATGEVWAQVPASDESDVNAAVAAAKAAFPGWAALPPDARSVYLKRVADLFVEHGEELAALESKDNGNPLPIMQYVNGEGMKVLWDRKAHETLRASTGRTVPLDPTTP